MRLGVFGGSFDPPHCGHLAIAQAAAQRFSLDRVWLCPTGRQPFKQAGSEASFADRMAMTRLLCEGDGRLLASELDAPHADGTPNYTVDALLALRAHHRDATLFVILGADALMDLPHWRDADRLFELATWIAVSRPGHELSEPLAEQLLFEQERGRLLLVKNVQVPVSSTGIRQKFHHATDPTDEELPETIVRYIHAHKLYGAGREIDAASPS